MRLQCDNHVILCAEFRRRVSTSRVRHMFFAIDPKSQPTCAHGCQVRSARDHAKVDIGARELDAQIAADCACPEDANLQDSLLGPARRGPRPNRLFMVYHTPEVNKLSDHRNHVPILPDFTLSAQVY